MCITFFTQPQSPDSPLFVLAFNRDETISRPTTPAHFWNESADSHILAGRDGQYQGTWLGISRRGRFAILTNLRIKGGENVTNAKSRGELVSNFLSSDLTGMEYLNILGAHSHEYRAFNLIVGQFIRTASGPSVDVTYYCKQDPTSPRLLDPSSQVYGISNGILSSNWPKVERGIAAFKTTIEKHQPDTPLESLCDEIVTGVMRDETKSEEGKAQDTGLDPQWEQQLSSVFLAPLDNPGRGLYGLGYSRCNRGDITGF
eukprot:TRINITY_DN8182_c0_g1_i1.p1 TRINITY_DN8182_c0_g1~~TRINITY_DN8182_c0_g1_i1.p1  ORF type:complete len:258 (-),score=49.59 TRINITY_DN8182_c0_g1_i1:152-925(-)